MNTCDVDVNALTPGEHGHLPLIDGQVCRIVAGGLTFGDGYWCAHVVPLDTPNAVPQVARWDPWELVPVVPRAEVAP